MSKATTRLLVDSLLLRDDACVTEVSVIMSALVYSEQAARPSFSTCCLSSDASTWAAVSEDAMSTLDEILSARSVVVGAIVGACLVVGAGIGTSVGFEVG